MEQLGGYDGTYFDGVFFTEQSAPSACLSSRPLRVEVSRQNGNLREVKARLAKQVKAHGGNALVGFTYGQRSHSLLAQLFTFKWDTEGWHGSGLPAKLGCEPTDTHGQA